MTGKGTNKKQSEPGLTSKLPCYQINLSYSVCVICCVVLIFLSEICLAHYLYRLIKSEINEEFVAKRDFHQEFLKESRSEIAKKEIHKILSEIEFFEQRARNTTRKKRNALLSDEDNLLNLSNDGPKVEFFNPKLRNELEAKDELERRKTGLKGAAPGGDSWVWLTSYCRIPMAAIQGFCSATREYCPPGPPGPEGPRGRSGVKGDRGEVGRPGIPGPIGARGFPGNTGEKGMKGSPGKHGLDGVPGDPGFDGAHGRNGQDGAPGRNGRDGRNGTDGRPGLVGPPGPPGPQGPNGTKGLPGPRGNPGKPGNHGSAGIPGIDAWKTRVNGSDELLMAPSITGNTYGSSRDPIVVHEGENVRLRCATKGVPKPIIIWSRTDGQLINTGTYKDSSIKGESLNLTQINRLHMGSYECIANNGVPPQASRTFNLEVHFPPLIKIRKQRIGVVIGNNATLECEVEAFPESVRYWERADGLLLEHGDKYNIKISNTERSGYKSKMQLNITRINIDDFTVYHCISKNERGITKGVFTVYEIDPSKAPIVEGGHIATFGVQAPAVVSIEDLCPPPTVCDECPPVKYLTSSCTGSGFLFDLLSRWQIAKYGDINYPEFPTTKREMDCELYAVGKPVYHGFINLTYGSWMRDSNPSSDKEGEKLWITSENVGTTLYEYDNKTVFRNHKPTKSYKLLEPFQGTAHVIYNGSFFYHAKGKPIITRYFLNNQTTKNIEVPQMLLNNETLLYSSYHNYLDFSADDNGLWVIFGVPDINNTAIMKVDVNINAIQYIWNISLDHHNVGEMFVVCGVLYAVNSVSERNSNIRFALDLYTNKLLDINLDFTNPFKNTTMVGYNHRNNELYTWDNGNQLTYPVRYNEIGYINMTTRVNQKN